MARFTLPRDLYHGKGALEALKYNAELQHIKKNRSEQKYICPLREIWCTIGDSNPGPTGYEPVALTN